ncbi:MAG: hypothetical protein KGI98_08590 [Euryarchaeota archaeon]|nr:hypothetical protein [Euryarchaeota archaeon]
MANRGDDNHIPPLRGNWSDWVEIRQNKEWFHDEESLAKDLGFVSRDDGPGLYELALSLSPNSQIVEVYLGESLVVPRRVLAHAHAVTEDRFHPELTRATEAPGHATLWARALSLPGLHETRLIELEREQLLTTPDRYPWNTEDIPNLSDRNELGVAPGSAWVDRRVPWGGARRGNRCALPQCPCDQR